VNFQEGALSIVLQQERTIGSKGKSPTRWDLKHRFTVPKNDALIINPNSCVLGSRAKGNHGHLKELAKLAAILKLIQAFLGAQVESLSFGLKAKAGPISAIKSSQTSAFGAHKIKRPITTCKAENPLIVGKAKLCDGPESPSALIGTMMAADLRQIGTVVKG